jgi:hypothetical protein
MGAPPMLRDRFLPTSRVARACAPTRNTKNAGKSADFSEFPNTFLPHPCIMTR